ncbi:MAG TPA: hypothetical protein VNO31_08120 [Umezawaea sp.]|jgi:hypothetical protein|nr:hypothetical protein [Umezawaea sp.]
MTERDFVVDTARSVVTDLAPDELALFEPVSRAYLRDPKKVLSDRERPGAVLGSGIDIAIALLSPVALGVATAVYEQLLDKAGEAIVERGGKLLKRVRRPKGAPVITADQLDGLRTLAIERAKELGVADDLAEKVGDALRATLEREL